MTCANKRKAGMLFVALDVTWQLLQPAKAQLIGVIGL
jgi:hypothetical protein